VIDNLLDGFDELSDEIESNRQTALRSTYTGTTQKPDEAARANRLSDQMGQPFGVVAANLADYEQDARRQEIDDAGRQSPHVGDFLADPRRMALASDEAPKLATYANSLVTGEARATPEPNILQQLIGGIVSGWHRGRANALSLLPDGPAVMDPATGRMTTDRSAEEAAIRADEERRAQAAERTSASTDRGFQAFDRANKAGSFGGAVRELAAGGTDTLGAITVTLGQSIGMGAPGLALTASTGGGSRVVTGLSAGTGSGLTEFGASIADAMQDAKVDPTDAYAVGQFLRDPQKMAAAREKAAKRGVAIGVFDALTAGIAGHFINNARRSATSATLRTGAEAGLQLTGGAAGEATAQLLTEEKLKWGDIIMEGLAEVPTGAVEVHANFQTAKKAGRVRWINERLDQVMTSGDSNERLRAATELASDLKLGERSPEDLKALTAQVAGEDARVYLDADQAQVLFQSAPQVLQDMVGGESALAEQLATGQVVIPMSEWMAAVPRLPNRDEILRSARTTAEGLSPAELETLDVETMARELGVPLDAPAPDPAAATARAQVQQSVMAQLVGTERYTPAQAESQAQLWGAMFGRLGELTGQDPVALYERYAAGIDAAEAPAEGVEAQPRTLMQRGMDALRGLFGRPQVATDGRGQQTIERDGSAYVQRAGQWLLADEKGQARDFLTLDQARTEAERTGGEIVQDDPIEGQRQTWSVALPDTAAREVLAGDILFQGGAAPRGQIQIGTDRAMQISLFKGADLSTFLHESGHFFLEVYRDLATAEDAAPQIRSDLDALLKWFGVESADQIGVDQHEQFARGFEAYLGEGRAPTPQLQSVFSQFKQWILGVYRSLRNLDVELTDDVRGVFDRMLASQEEIEAAQARVGFEPIARDLAEAQALGMTERQFADYQQQIAAAREQAEADVMTQLQEADARARERWWKDELANIRSEVEAEVEATPIVRAYRVLTGRKEAGGEPVPEQLQGLKLDRAVLAATYGDGLLDKMGRVTAKEGGMPPSDVAALLGFANGDELVQGLWTVRQTLAGVEAQAEARMRSRHGDPMTDGTLPNRALAAMHSNSRIRILERELGVLADLTREPRLNRRQLRAVAEAVLAGKPVGAIRPNDFLVAERKAARSAATAAAKGRYGEALQAKRQQAFNAVLYRNATEALDAIQRITKRAAGLTRRPAQERLAKAGNGFLPNVNGLLSAYGFGGSPSIDSTALADWVETLQDSGEVTAVSDAVIARLDSPARLVDIPLSEAREFGEAIKNLSHLASRQNQLLAGARKADKDGAIAEMLERSSAVLGEAKEFVSEDDLPPAARAARAANGLLDDIDRPESILEKLDGGETGPWHDFIWHAQEQAESKKSELMRRVGGQLKKLHAGLPKNWEDNLRQVATFKGVAMTRRRLIGMALNLGNAGNRQRLMEGGFTTSTRTILLTEGDLNSLAAMLSPTELRYVQGMWDAIGSMRPDIEALNARIGGVPVQFVEAVPFDVQMPGGEVIHMAGGYFPLAYDSTRSVVGDVQSNEDAMKVLMATGAGRAATSKGYVKGRAATVKAALNLDYGLVVNRHLDQVMTDLSYREAVRDVHMLLNDPRIKNYVSSRLSPSALRSLTGGLAYSVVGSTEAAGNVAKWRAFGDGLLANSTVAALALRPDIALGNYGSALVQGVDRSSVPSVLRSFVKFQANRAELTQEIIEKSPFMASKLQEVDHMYATTIGKIRGNRWKGAHAGYTRLMMTLHRMADADVSRVIWLARYEIERRKGTPDVDAVKLADKAIRMTQTATGKKDLSTFERDPALRQTRQYMGPMFVIFGRLRAATEGSGAARVGSARMASLFLQWVLAPTVFAMLAGRMPNDDDDGEKDWMTWAVTEIGLFPLQTLPLVRDVASIAESHLAGRQPNSRSAPLATAINNMGKATQRISKRMDSGESIGESWDEYTVDLLQFAGPLVGAPSTQAKKWDKAYKKIWDDPDTGTLELTQMAVYGETPFYADGEVLPENKAR